MHKICLEVKDEQELRQLSATLTENNIKHKLWIEMPENIPTALALKVCLSSLHDLISPITSLP